MILTRLLHRYDVPSTNIYWDKAPAYSMREKADPKALCVHPGPSAYYSERVIVNKPSVAKITMGIKHSPCAGSYVGRVESRCHTLARARPPKSATCMNI